MKVIKIDLDHPQTEVIQKAARLILDGGVVVMPTDTAYALVVNIFDQQALKRLIQIKQRPRHKPFPVGVVDVRQARGLACFNRKALELARKYWPGALTLVLPKKKTVSALVSGGHDKVGLRIPNSPVCFALAQEVKVPYTITSANLSAGPTPYSLLEIERQFQGQKARPDLILDGGKLPQVPPSTVVEVMGQRLKVLRAGPIQFN